MCNRGANDAIGCPWGAPWTHGCTMDAMARTMAPKARRRPWTQFWGFFDRWNQRTPKHPNAGSNPPERHRTGAILGPAEGENPGSRRAHSWWESTAYSKPDRPMYSQPDLRLK